MRLNRTSQLDNFHTALCTDCHVLLTSDGIATKIDYFSGLRGSTNHPKQGAKPVCKTDIASNRFHISGRNVHKMIVLQLLDATTADNWTIRGGEQQTESTSQVSQNRRTVRQVCIAR